RDVREVEAATLRTDVAVLGADQRHLGGGDGAAVQGYEVVAGTEAANRYLVAFAVEPVDRDTGNTLHRLCEVCIRELADILGRDGIDDARRVALDVHRTAQAAAYTGNSDLFDRILSAALGK